MTTAVQRRRGTNTEHASFTGLEGEISVNTTNESVHVHDGSTAGGFELMRADGSNSSVSLGDITGVTAGTGLSGGGTSGTVTLNIDGTVATLAGTQTFTNKTLTSPILNTPDINAGSIDGTAIGASSASTGAFTTLTATGAFTSVGIDDNATSTAITIDSSENVGIGMTPPSDRNLAVYDGTNSIFSMHNSTTGTAAGDGFQLQLVSDDAYLVNYEAGGMVAFYTAPSGGSTTERMRIDSSGNVGIGTSSPSTRLTVGDGASSEAIKVNAGSGWADLRLNSSASNGGSIYWNDGADAGQIFYYHPDNSMRFHTAATERMRIDSSGNVGIGRIPRVALDVDGEVAIAYNSTYGLRFYNQPQNNWSSIGNTETSSSANLVFKDGSGEAFRLDGSGNLLVGKTAVNFTTVGAELRSNGQINSGSTADFLNMFSTSASAYRFYVTNAGTIKATNTTISAISDQRFKENIRDLDDGLSKVMELRPRKFDWKEGKGADIKDDRGFIAQEFEQVFPDLVGEWKDEAPEGEEPYKAVSQDLIPTLVKAIQEQQTLIESLTARIAALEE